MILFFICQLAFAGLAYVWSEKKVKEFDKKYNQGKREWFTFLQKFQVQMSTSNALVLQQQEDQRNNDLNATGNAGNVTPTR